MKTTRWIVRIIALLTLVFGLLFYFGYGNPLPFVSTDYSVWDNIVLTMYPLSFIGLALGLRYEKLGAYFITIPIAIGLLVGLTTEADFTMNMLFPLFIGIVYFVIGYSKPQQIDNSQRKT